jgi:hypothetical protein
MTLRDTFLSIPTRERGGSIAADRFDFQKDWALCHLLDLHISGQDYCLVFEHHEDIVVLDDEVAPRQAHFYQVKTREAANWSIGELLRRPNASRGPKYSILGKLYFNRIRFDEACGTLNFVSNAHFRLKLRKDAKGPCTNRTRLEAHELSEEVQFKIAQQLRDEHGLQEDLDFASITIFHVSDLSLKGHSQHTMGKLADFLESHFPDSRFRIKAIYNALFGEIRRKNSSSQAPTSFEDFVATQAIGRSDFDNMLRTIGAAPRSPELWLVAESRLNAESYPYSDLLAIRAEWSKYEVQSMDLSNDAIQSLRNKLIALLQSPTITALPSLRQQMDNLVRACSDESPTLVNGLSPAFVRAAALTERLRLQ